MKLNIYETFPPHTFDNATCNKETVLMRGARTNDNNVQFVKVSTHLVCDAEGIPIGIANENPLLDTRQYAVAFRDR